jgi:hypothetical protein
LKYNVNLPDVLNRYVVTSQGSTSRECLQEIKLLTDGFGAVDDKELSDLLTHIAGIGLDAASRACELTDIGSVNLSDIQAVRNDPVWKLHHGIALENLPDNRKPLSSQNFLRDPLASVQAISNSLKSMARSIRLAKDGKSGSARLAYLK